MMPRIGLPLNWPFWSLALFVFCCGCAAEIPQETASKDAAPPATDATATMPRETEAAPSGGLKRIIILVNNPSPFWDACRAGVLDSNGELNLEAQGYVASMEVPDGTIQGQLDRLRQFATQSDIAAIGISPLESDNAAIADELKKLKDKGIPVITFDSDLDRERFRDLRYAFLGTNNRGAGEVLGQCAQVLRPYGGEYVTFVGRTGAQNAIERIDGFAAGAGEKFVQQDKMADGGDRSKAQENVRNALRNHPDLNNLVGIWSYNAPAIVDVVREQKVRNKVAVTVFDAEPGTIAAMKQGDVDVLVVQDPYAMGMQSVKLLAALLKKDDATVKEMLPTYGEPDGDLFDTGIKVVVPSDDSPIKADLFPGKVQHMTLPTFEAWLQKYGLTGS
ncbi:substrate-binding domain-containing protein [bacterium]|nr:substrate-binding domain-containing protein [bacterium]